MWRPRYSDFGFLFPVFCKLVASWMMRRGALQMETEGKTVLAPMARASTRCSGGTKKGAGQMSRFHHCRSELKPIKTLDSRRFIWPGNQCQLHSFPTEDKRQMRVVFLYRARGMSNLIRLLLQLFADFPICGLCKGHVLTAVAKKIYWGLYWRSQWRPI